MGAGPPVNSDAWTASDLRDAGAEYKRTVVPDPITLDWILGQCDLLERGIFPTPSEQAALDEIPPRTMTLALRRWGLLRHFHYQRNDRRSPDRRESAARKLLKREPVVVELTSSRSVAVTSRSYAAMYEMARHFVRLQELEADVEAIEIAWRESKIRARRRRLMDLHRRALNEALLHRQAIYAHALTPNGAPAESLDDAPDWWSTINPVDDVLLLTAIFQAGHQRYNELGDPPPPRYDSQRPEDFGWHTLFADIAREERIDPAEPYDRDLFQQLTRIRASAPPVPRGS